MSFGDMQTGAKIYIWEYGGLTAVLPTNDRGVGHASIFVRAANGFDYLSWWPKEGDEGLGNREHQRPRGYGQKMKEGTREQHKEDNRRITDKELEDGKKADFKYRITGQPVLDWDAMLKFIDDLSTGKYKCSYWSKPGAYNVRMQNCSTTVAHCLRAGGADDYVKWPNHTVWTPRDIFKYCEELMPAINKDNPNTFVKTR